MFNIQTLDFFVLMKTHIIVWVGPTIMNRLILVGASPVPQQFSILKMCALLTVYFYILVFISHLF